MSVAAFSSCVAACMVPAESFDEAHIKLNGWYCVFLCVSKIGVQAQANPKRFNMSNIFQTISHGVSETVELH